MCSKYIALGDLLCVPYLYEYQDNRTMKMEATEFVKCLKVHPLTDSASWDRSCSNPSKAQHGVLKGTHLHGWMAMIVS